MKLGMRLKKKEVNTRERLARDLYPANIRKVSIFVQRVESPSSKLDTSRRRCKAFCF